uniref:PSI domain-containing protein n=1 Tax=Trichobilharzia regenti TaxID=157069 RepID=A0AA85JUY2_TRIRE|nr:unnamed protein product [Trichobilharzia regenti]
MRQTRNTLYSVLFIGLYFVGLSLAETFVQLDEIADIVPNVTKARIEPNFERHGPKSSYYYTQNKKYNQPPPIAFETFNKSSYDIQKELHIPTQFRIKYYGEEYGSVGLLATGALVIGSLDYPSANMRRIKTFPGRAKGIKVEIIDEKSLLAIKWLDLTVINESGEETVENVEVVCVIYPNGNILIYFEKIPEEVESADVRVTVEDGLDFVTGSGRKLMISYGTDKSLWFALKMRMLMEFIPNPNICSVQRSFQQCTNASTEDVTCYWCEIAGFCSNGCDSKYLLWQNPHCDVNVTSPCLLAFEDESHVIYHQTPHPAEEDSIQLSDVRSFYTTYTISDFRTTNPRLFLFILIPTALIFIIMTISCGLWLLVGRRRPRDSTQKAATTIIYDLKRGGKI